MHFFDLIDLCVCQRPFVPFRITTSAGAVLPVAKPDLLTVDKADSILRLMHRSADGIWLDVTIRGSQVASFEIPSALYGGEASPSSQEPQP